MAEKSGIHLNTIDGFPGEPIERLAELWITTAEEFVEADRRDDGRRGLAEFLAMSEGEVSDMVALAQDVLPVDFDTGEGDIDYFGMGALDEGEGDELEDESFSFAALPTSVNLLSRMPPVRNQRGRGTCVAFTCAAVREYLLGEDSAAGDLSEQFLYWDCKQRDSYNGSGTWIKVGMAVLKEDGICSESVWSYNPNPLQGNEGQGPPPEIANVDAAERRISASGKLPAKGINTIREKLADELPVAFAVPVYTYWFSEPVRTSGDIRMPLPTEKVEGGHAMCMVGYEDDADVPGGGYFIVRNSWGTAWGANNVAQAGYCRIPYAYIQNYGRSAYVAFGAADNGGKNVVNEKISLLDTFFTWLRNLF